MVPGNFPKFCGLVMFTVEFAVSNHRVSGKRSLASMRTVTLNFSNCQVLVMEYCGHQTFPVRAHYNLPFGEGRRFANRNRVLNQVVGGLICPSGWPRIWYEPSLLAANPPSST